MQKIQLPIKSEAISANENHEIVIILDSSQSMEEVDANYVSPDFITGLAASLPTHYRMGLVVYQEEIIEKLPMGSSHTMVKEALEELSYKRYGDAGTALATAVSLFQEEDSGKRIIWITDGELLLSTEEETQESVLAFNQAMEEIRNQGIVVDVLALGEKKTEGETVYSSAQLSGGVLQEFATGEDLSLYLGDYLFSDLSLRAKQVGSLTGMNGALTITLPDNYMDKSKILLLGRQENQNLTVSGEAKRMDVYKGITYTIIDLLEPDGSNITIQALGEDITNTEVEAYFFSEYSFFLSSDHSFWPQTRMTQVSLTLESPEGDTLFTEDSVGEIEVFLEGEKQDYTIDNGIALLPEQSYEESTQITVEVSLPDEGNYYFGETTVVEEVFVPKPEEPRPDLLFWGILLLFLLANGIIICLAIKKKSRQAAKRPIEEKGIPLVEKDAGKTTFYGKLVVYVIQNKEEIDYPPASINLFARCNRSVITLEWVLDTCSLPLSLKGADQITFKPGKDKNLVVQNKGKASALKGKELLLKGNTYPMYYHEKITFLFEEEGAEIEVHYKDLKPSER